MRRDANPVMTFPIKKRVKTELIGDRTAALYIVYDQIKNATRVVKHGSG